MENRKRLHHIESIRALAALSVAIFHFTNAYHVDRFLIADEGTRSLFTYGAQGVEIFYVISGFIIPYSLYYSTYKVKHYFHYLSKRLSRLLPPYWVTIAIIIAVGFLQAKFLWGYAYDFQMKNYLINGLFAVDFVQAFPSLLNYFPDNAWINPVFETLKVELQFYLLIGLTFPFINKYKTAFIALSLLLLLFGIYTPSMNTVLVNSPYFLLGIAAFYIFQEGWKWQYTLIVFLCTASLFNFYVWQDLIAATIAFSLVLWLPSNFKFLGFTGKISYSYYLIHGITGGQLLYFSRDSYLALNYPFLMVIFALLASWLGAFLIYYFVEKPSLKISKRIKYKP